MRKSPGFSPVSVGSLVRISERCGRVLEHGS